MLRCVFVEVELSQGTDHSLCEEVARNSPNGREHRRSGERDLLSSSSALPYETPDDNATAAISPGRARNADYRDRVVHALRATSRVS